MLCVLCMVKGNVFNNICHLYYHCFRMKEKAVYVLYLCPVSMVKAPCTVVLIILNAQQKATSYYFRQIGIYEDISKPKQIIVHDEKNLTMGSLFSEGRYGLLHEGILQTNGGEISVIVKSICSKFIIKCIIILPCIQM